MGKFCKRIDLSLKRFLEQFVKYFYGIGNQFQKKYRCKNLAELTAEKNRLEVLISKIADGAILLDDNFHILLINPVAINFLDLELVLSRGQSIIKCLPFEISSQLLPSLKELINLSLESDFWLYTQELTVRLASNKQKILKISLNLVIISTKDLSKGIAMTIRDITQETELNEIKNKFIANVSHELRTPLFTIRSFLETLYDYNESLTDLQKLEFLDIANKETIRLTCLVDDILNLSKLELSREYQFQSFEISLLIEQVMSLYQLTVKEKNIQIIIQTEPNLSQIYANYDLLLQSILNLVTNALKFTNKNGQIVIRALFIEDSLEGPRKIRIEVSDTGIGIAEIDHASIFERFLRVENEICTSYGTGLGLSIVQNSIRQHDSCVYVRSEIDNGSTFWFDL